MLRPPRRRNRRRVGHHLNRARRLPLRGRSSRSPGRRRLVAPHFLRAGPALHRPVHHRLVRRRLVLPAIRVPRRPRRWSVVHRPR
jgi:hypothetical protein